VLSILELLVVVVLLLLLLCHRGKGGRGLLRSCGLVFLFLFFLLVILQLALDRDGLLLRLGLGLRRGLVGRAPTFGELRLPVWRRDLRCRGCGAGAKEGPCDEHHDEGRSDQECEEGRHEVFRW
jgi:hypothetical protein